MEQNDEWKLNLFTVVAFELSITGTNFVAIFDGVRWQFSLMSAFYDVWFASQVLQWIYGSKMKVVGLSNFKIFVWTQQFSQKLA